MSVELATLLAGGGINLAALLAWVWVQRMELRFLRDVYRARRDRRDLEVAGAVLREGRRGGRPRPYLPPN